MDYKNNNLEEIRKQRKHFQDVNATLPKGVRHRKKYQKRSTLWSRKSQLFTLKNIAMWPSLAMAVVILSLMIAWWIESEQKADRNLVYDPETLPPTAAGQATTETSAEKAPRQTSAGGTTKPLDTTAIDAANTNKPAPLHKPNEAVSAAPAASTSLDTDSVADSSNPQQPLQSTSSKASTSERPDPVSIKQPIVIENSNGPWVINLVSSSIKTDADRLAQKARSMGIQTEQQQVIVKGKQYWRVQITGFSTEEAASAYAYNAKEKLGLQDVWIMKR